MENMSIKSEHIKPHIGEVVHIDKANMLDKAVGQRVLELLDERGVLVFPRINLTDEEQLAFTESLGPRVNYSRVTPGSNYDSKDVYKVTLDEINDRPEYVLGTFFWHMDGLTSDIPPPKATLLTARKTAPKGGQTEFASTFAAYENLPESDKKDIADLKAVHSLSASIRCMYDGISKEEKDRVDSMALTKAHPIVWSQKCGRRSLIVGTTTDRIEGMPLPEGRALLERLLEWTAQPDFVYRHQWEVGDLVIWNNPGNLHRVIPYDRKSGRMMHRTTLAGTEQVQ
jgi:alpha-ketoglutarate-dependent taurine dioxygenase